jgi:ribosome maturation factor RimP
VRRKTSTRHWRNDYCIFSLFTNRYVSVVLITLGPQALLDVVADTAMIMIYLGLTVDDLTKAHEKLDDYLDLVRLRMNANPDAIIEVVSSTLFAR